MALCPTCRTVIPCHCHLTGAVPAAVSSAGQATATTPPSHRAGLREQIAAAMREHYLSTNRADADADRNMPCVCGDWREPGAEADDENDWDSHLADAVLAVLYREWPWLRAEAEDAEPADQTALTVWIDGHPQLEAIAAAVWEKCGRSDSGMCVEDDPRNIAVAALAVVLPATTDPGCGTRDLLAEATRPQPAPTDRSADDVRDQLLHAIDHAYTNGVLGYGTPEALLAAYDASRAPVVDRAALRDRITTAISRWHRDPEQPLYEQGADAVLAVLPAPTDRAAEVERLRELLREATAGAAVADDLTAEWRIRAERAEAELKQLPADRAAVRSAALHEAAARYAKLTDQNEAYDRKHGELDEEARLRHEVVRDVVAGLRRMADETPDAQTARPVTPMTVYLSTPCDTCDHTLNWHRNDVGCTVPRCVCGRFQEPAAERQDDEA